MSWLSDLFGGGDEGPDPYLLEQQRQREERAAAEAKAEADRLRVQGENRALRERSTTSGRDAALKYFSDLGLDSQQYAPDIESEIARILGTTAEDDPNVGSYLADLGSSVYGQKENALRTRSGRDIDMLFQPEFERSRIADTADDPILAEINTAERGEADTFLQNLRKRGVITDTGYAGGQRNLDDQGARVRSILDEIGQGTLSSGRDRLTNIANRGRQTAQTLKLGQNFDPSVYAGEADTATTDFFGGLGDKIRGQITDNLYDTSGLAAIAGAAQGAGNTKFDPNALAGLIQDDDEEEDPLKPKRVTF